nr:reverse transcriptase domain-containing protein [Tanacetum cinerariifolium]
MKKEKVAENASNKRKWEGNHNGSLSQQNKGHKVPRAHTTWPINKKEYVGSLPLCNQCKFHHNGPCTVKYGNCKKVGHIIQNCKTPDTAKNQRTRTCYECGSLRHYKSECPIVKFHKRVDMFHGGVRASKPKTMQDAIEIATKLKKKRSTLLLYARLRTRGSWIIPLRTIRTNNNRTRDKILTELTLQGTGRRNITADLSRCVLNASITIMVHVLPNATSITIMAYDCRSSTNANTTNIQKGTAASQKATCYECGNQEHYRRDCLKRKNQNHENQIESTEACRVVHTFGRGETEQDINNIDDEIEA